MVEICFYCSPDTAGNHAWDCPCNPRNMEGAPLSPFVPWSKAKDFGKIKPLPATGQDWLDEIRELLEAQSFIPSPYGPSPEELERRLKKWFLRKLEEVVLPWREKEVIGSR